MEAGSVGWISNARSHQVVSPENRAVSRTGCKYRCGIFANSRKAKSPEVTRTYAINAKTVNARARKKHYVQYTW